MVFWCVFRALTPWEVQFYHFTSETTPGLVYQCLGAPDGRVLDVWWLHGMPAFLGKEEVMQFPSCKFQVAQ